MRRFRLARTLAVITATASLTVVLGMPGSENSTHRKVTASVAGVLDEVPPGYAAPVTDPFAWPTPGFGPRTSAGCAPATSDDNRIQVYYVHSSDWAGRLSDVRSGLLQDLDNVDTVFLASSLRNGGVPRQLRWVTDSSCQPTITELSIPNSGTTRVDGTYADSVPLLKAAVSNAANRHALFLVDPKPGLYTPYGGANPDPVCGEAQNFWDFTPGLTNQNNTKFTLARVDPQCWDYDWDPYAPSSDVGWYSAIAHEVMHTLGAVLGDVISGAPHADRGGHCNDEFDTMCYDDGYILGGLQTVCPASQEWLFDCGADDYFNTSPSTVSDSSTARGLTSKTGTTIWNTASSTYLYVPQAPVAGDLNNGLTGGFTEPTGLSATYTLPVTASSGQGWRADWTLDDGDSGTWAALARQACKFTSNATPSTPGWNMAVTTLRCPVYVNDGTGLKQVPIPSVTATITQQDTQHAAASDSVGGGALRQVDLTVATGSSNVDKGQYVPVTITARDHTTGQPIWGLPINLTGPDGNTEITDGLTGHDGTIATTVPVASSGTFTATVDPSPATASSNGAGTVYLTATSSAPVTAWNPSALTMNASGTYVTSGSSITLSGTLTSTGTPLTGQSVTLRNTTTGTDVWSGTTDSAGTVSTSVTVTGNATYQWQWPGSSDTRAAYSPGVDVGVSTPTDLTLTGPSTTTATAPVTYTATLTANGNPAAGQDLTLTAGGGNVLAHATTGSDGTATFTLTAPAAQSWQLTAAYAGSGPLQASARVWTTTVQPRPSTLSLTGPAAATWGQKITLTATLYPTLSPAGPRTAGAGIALVSSTGTVLTAATNSSGVATFTVTAAPGLSWHAAYGGSGVDAAAQSGQVRPAVSHSIALSLAGMPGSIQAGKAFTLTATLTWPGAAATPGARVTLWQDPAGAGWRQIAAGTTNTSGQTRFTVVANLRGAFQARFAGGAITYAGATVSSAASNSAAPLAHVTVGITLHAKTTVTHGVKATLTGTVTPARNGRVVDLVVDGHTVAKAKTNSHGTYTFHYAYAKGRHSLHVTAPGSVYNEATTGATVKVHAT